MRIRASAPGALVWLFPSLLMAQSPSTGFLAGRVTSRGDSAAGPALPAANVMISVEPGGRRARSDASGRFIIGEVRPGAVTVRARLFGFRTAEQVALVTAGDTTRIELVLVAAAQQLAEVRADARSEAQRTFETRPAIATVGLTAAAMAGVPKLGEPDVIRVVQLLPGVVSRNDFNTGLNVRGGEADQNLVLLDGFPIYNPFHLGGLFSTFMDATVGGIELMSGAFPARFGGRLSSVLDVRSAAESRPGINTTADISALGTSMKLGGIVGDGRGSWSVAGRRTYADAAADVFSDEIFPYHFGDLHARATWALTPATRFALTAYTGRDVLELNLAEVQGDSAQTARDGAWSFDWGNQVVGMSIAREVGPTRVPLVGWTLEDGATLEQRVSTSAFSTTLDVGDGAFAQHSELRDVRFAGSVTARASSHETALGYDVATYRIRYTSGAEQLGTTDFAIAQAPTAAAVWFDDLWRVSSRWILQSGVRAEALTGRNYVGVSPRLSLKYFAMPDLALTAGAGRVTQFTHSMAGDGPLRYFDIWLVSDPWIPVASAWHYVAGAERLRGHGSIRVETFFKKYDRALELNPSEDPGRRGDEFHVTAGHSYGVDLLAQWRRGRALSGWLAYTYGVSSRSRDGERWAPGHDRRHDVDVVATWRPGRYRVGARVGYATGSPYTPIVGQIARRVYDPSLDRWGTGDPRLFIESIGAGRNSARFPASHRLDVDASRDFQTRGVSWSPYVSVVNAYNARNVFVYLYDYSTDSPTRRAISQFPVLPSAGVRIAF